VSTPIIIVFLVCTHNTIMASVTSGVLLLGVYSFISLFQVNSGAPVLSSCAVSDTLHHPDAAKQQRLPFQPSRLQ